MTKKYVYFFGKGESEGNASMKAILGGKGANLADMAEAGVPVPPGFTITTEVCEHFSKNAGTYPEGLNETVAQYVKRVETATSFEFGNPTNPLLFSVRSGAAVSMPGMMDTILNLGINDAVAKGIAEKTGNPRFAWDSYRRFIQMFGDVAMDVPHHAFEKALDSVKAKKVNELGKSVHEIKDTDLNATDLQDVVEAYKAVYRKYKGTDFPTDPMVQLWHAVAAVFRSWDNDRAVAYRELNDIKGLIGTAVNVQSMVFGNMGETSATGVGFTRNPSNGEKEFYGEFLVNAQGEDVVAGIRTPLPIIELEKVMPAAFKQLKDITDSLELRYRDIQDFEFTIQEGTLYMLQTRNGKRTVPAAVKIAVDMVEEGLITKEEAVLRVNANDLTQLLLPIFESKARENATILASGINASPGASVGVVVFNAEDAEKEAAEGKDVILVRIETSPEDIRGMAASKGILTARGGATSHAAVVARGMGKCCVAGAGDLMIDYEKNLMVVSGQTIKYGDVISLDGTTGHVLLGTVPTIKPELSGNFAKLMTWADEIRGDFKIRTNADTPHDAAVAISFGAEGIGLCRTEHMFFEEDRIDYVREMILANDEAGRRKPLAELKKMQKKDFLGILEAMKGLPVTIRLLDPPLHEFLPHTEEQIVELAYKINRNPVRIKERVEQLHEFNPMLGHRGVRLGITYPEIYEMQIEAILEAAAELVAKGVDARPEIMIPLVGDVSEFTPFEKMTRSIAENVMKKYGVNFHYLVGTMIEVPRAAMTADEIATQAEFFSFGTNDLTQMGAGFSRDDAGSFLKEYVHQGIYDKDPFQVLDQKGIGRLIQSAVQYGKSTRPNIKLGICGEHGGEPSSIEFCYKTGLNYVSCSPYRVPTARLAAAQAVVKNKK
ncbi:pyruvate, phosphate dikinase [bacterium]|nr:pyruvate, phosphate dikinase [bacterium]